MKRKRVDGHEERTIPYIFTTIIELIVIITMFISTWFLVDSTICDDYDDTQLTIIGAVWFLSFSFGWMFIVGEGLSGGYKDTTYDEIVPPICLECIENDEAWKDNGGSYGDEVPCKRYYLYKSGAPVMSYSEFRKAQGWTKREIKNEEKRMYRKSHGIGLFFRIISRSFVSFVLAYLGFSFFGDGPFLLCLLIPAICNFLRIASGIPYLEDGCIGDIPLGFVSKLLLVLTILSIVILSAVLKNDYHNYLTNIINTCETLFFKIFEVIEK